MSDCGRYEELIGRLVASDIDDRDLSELLAHGKSCESCGRLLAIHADLAAAGARLPDPGDAELDLRQAQVLATIDRRRSRRPLRLAALAAAVALPFLAGLLAGRALAGRGGGTGAVPRLMDALQAEAAGNHALGDVEDSPFNYSNVSYRKVAGDRVELEFDLSTHLTVVEAKQSPLVREVLAQSLLNPSSVGERLKAMSLAAGELNPKLQEAIVFALRRDDSVAVRMAALSVLAGSGNDEAVQQALMNSLRDDPSVQVRLAALESLASHRVDHGRIREAIEDHDKPGGEALMVRLAELEKHP